MIHIVNVLPDADLAAVLDALAQIGAVSAPYPRTPRYLHIEAPAEAADEISAVSGVCNCADPDAFDTKLDLLDDHALETVQALGPELWGLGFISGHDDLTRYEYDAAGHGVVVANVDTPAEEVSDFGNRFEKVYDPHGIANTTTHGTATLGWAGGTIFGVAKGVLLRNFAGFRGDGSANTDTITGALSAVADYAEDNPNKKIVLNCSFSSSGTLAGNPYTAVIDRLRALGVVIVAAAGNGDSNGNGFLLGGTLTRVWPAMDPDVICVGAHDIDAARATFSNYGGNTAIFSPGVGCGYMRPDGTHGSGSGTSIAAPYVAGMIACALEAGITDPRAWLLEEAIPGLIANVSSGTRAAAHKPAELYVDGVAPPQSGAEPALQPGAIVLDARNYDFLTSATFEVSEDGYSGGFSPFHIIDERHLYD